MSCLPYCPHLWSPDDRIYPGPAPWTRSSLLDFLGSLEFAGWDAGQGVSSRWAADSPHKDASSHPSFSHTRPVRTVCKKWFWINSWLYFNPVFTFSDADKILCLKSMARNKNCIGVSLGSWIARVKEWYNSVASFSIKCALIICLRTGNVRSVLLSR